MRDAERLRANLRLLTSYVPGRAEAGEVISRRRDEAGHVVEELELGGAVPATLIRPDRTGRCPAVLYCHAHGGDYALGRRELMDGSRFLQMPGFGTALANLGFAAMCIDMPGFGGRRCVGGEAALSKALLWHGKILFGQMLNDLGEALGYLTGREEIAHGHLYTLGLSMGAAHAYWLAALDDRVAGCAHLSMLADIGPMIETGVHDRHGVYLTVPGLLNLAETGDVAGLIAPRPQIVCHGGKDHLTPPSARDAALSRLRHAYRAAQAEDALETMIDPVAPHGESASMRVAVLDFLARAARRPVHFAAM